MSIQKISKEQLRRMGDQEGLILQGCGGDPQEWLDGINQILTEEGILKKGARFEECFQEIGYHSGRQPLLKEVTLPKLLLQSLLFQHIDSP